MSVLRSLAERLRRDFDLQPGELGDLYVALQVAIGVATVTLYIVTLAFR